jgi:hypothetical protein
VVVVGRGHSPPRTLIAPPLAALGALPYALDGDVGRRLPVAACFRLLSSWGKTKFGRLTTGGVLGGDASQLLGGVPESVIVFALVWVQRATFRSRARVPLVNLLASLGLGALTTSPRWGLG